MEKVDLDELESRIYIFVLSHGLEQQTASAIAEFKAARQALNKIKGELPSYNCDCSFSVIRRAIEEYDKATK